ncbi:MAG TPA: DUF6689 family protein [Candidatus Polarisedimenticolaceae bacterium]|nr:DUF6689 family protein [Candidatus Polarisedimenticolaceae bacterium]
MKHAQIRGLFFAACTLVPGWAAADVVVEVAPNRATVHIELPGDVKADVELRFEQALGLTADSLGISARLLDPADLGLSARLPASVSVPVVFPLLITIDPPASGPLAFSGVVAFDLHTHKLTYAPNSPLRLFAAEGGKSFQDITASIGLGSYRTGANKGGFSEFLIAADTRALASVIDEKFKRLQARLDANAARISSAVLATLQTQLRAARSSYDANDAQAASEKVEQFADIVRQNSGAAIPDVWRSARDVVNVAGELRADASTLKFSLLLKASGGS